MTENHPYIVTYLNLFLRSGLPFLVDKLLSWQFVVLFVFFCLRTSLQSLMSRVKEFHSTGFHFLWEQDKGKVDLSKNQSFITPGRSTQEALTEVLQKRKYFIEQLIDDYKTEVRQEVLLDNFTSCEVALCYERMYACIFKSQLDALKTVNLSKSGLSKDEFMYFYNKAREENPREYANTSFEKWSSFLVNNFIQQKKTIVFFYKRINCFC